MQQITVEEMSAALGLGVVVQQPRARRVELPRILVRLSVRNGGGLPICYKRKVYGISKLQAEIDVKKMARAEGFTVWATLEVTVVGGVQ